ncbi:MAG: InlB B-repeat-containing protein [Kiritimatiellae bacterium]|nr:InlB B-repeat-containing protein [Kiritimatiellia bacterium]
MKKLLAMMSAVAMAMGLYAADPGALSGTSFEGLGDGTPLDINGTTGELIAGTSGYWTTNGTDTLTVRYSDSLQESSVYRAAAFSGFSNTNYLEVKTESLTNYVSRYIKNTPEDRKVSIGERLYFDSYVRFTAFDGDQVIDLGTDGKLAIWIKEVEPETSGDPTTTNLVITAGYLLDSETHSVSTNYDCTVGGITVGDGGWHRVTVMAVGSIYTSAKRVTPGFVVFVDGIPASCEAAKGITSTENLTNVAKYYNNVNQLFPSADQDSTEYDKISVVDFAGQGDVDELVFTKTAPGFAGTFNIVVDEDIEAAIAHYTVRGSNGSVQMAPGSTNVLPYVKDNTYFSLEVTNKAGYTNDVVRVNIREDDEIPGKYIVTNFNASATIKAVAQGVTITIDGEEPQSFATLADAVDVINALSEETSLTLTLNAPTTGNFELDNPNANVVLDLAGNTFTGESVETPVIYVMAGALTVIDTVDGGVVQSAVDQGSLVNAVGVDEGATVAIRAGTYNGRVDATAITGGRFLHEYNEEEVNTAGELKISDGYAATLTDNYYVVAPALGPWTVTFLNEDGTTNATFTVNNGETSQVPETPAKEHYTFLGWYPDNIGALTPYDFTQPITSDVTVRARYEAETYTVTFNAPGASTKPEDQLVEYLGHADEPQGVPSKDYYTFRFWSEDGTTEFDFVNTAIISNTTLTAVYTANSYTITFVNENGVDPASTNYTIEAGEILLPTATTEETGVQFAGWTNETITAAITNFTPTAENVGSFTLYAKWSPTGSSGYDGGAGNTFTIAPGTVAAVESATGHKMTDTVAGSDVTYAQAYALGLVNESTGAVADLGATIEMKNGKVVIGLSSTPNAAYTITLKVYEKDSLAKAWPVEPTQTYTIDSETATTGFTPGDASAGFYKTEVTIRDK